MTVLFIMYLMRIKRFGALKRTVCNHLKIITIFPPSSDPEQEHCNVESDQYVVPDPAVDPNPQHIYSDVESLSRRLFTLPARPAANTLMYISTADQLCVLLLFRRTWKLWTTKFSGGVSQESPF
jgi:hypothetical protein